MKRLIAATLLALAAAPVFANDVASVIPAAPAAGSQAAAVAVVRDAPFGNADVASVIPELPLTGYASASSGYLLAHANPFGNADITCTIQ